MQECLPERPEGSQAQQLDPAKHSPSSSSPAPTPPRGWEGGEGGKGRRRELLIQLDRASGAPGWQICLRELSCCSFGKERALSPAGLPHCPSFQQGILRSSFQSPSLLAVLEAGMGQHPPHPLPIHPEVLSQQPFPRTHLSFFPHLQLSLFPGVRWGRAESEVAGAESHPRLSR